MITKKQRANLPQYEIARLKVVTSELTALKKRVRKLLKEMHLSEINEGNEVDDCPLCQLYRDCEMKP